jgi:RAD54-like protein 2
MYDNIVESLQRLQTTPGLGCILAHSMGCGKTLQVITFIDILSRYTTAKSILVVVPINTIQNWASEFNRWCPVDDPNIEYKRPYQLYILNEVSKKFVQRAKIVQNWSQTGGTLIIGYEMFRLMITKKSSQTSTSTKMNNSNKIANISSPMTPITNDPEDEEKNTEILEGKRKIFVFILNKFEI